MRDSTADSCFSVHMCRKGCHGAGACVSDHDSALHRFRRMSHFEQVSVKFSPVAGGHRIPWRSRNHCQRRNPTSCVSLRDSSKARTTPMCAGTLLPLGSGGRRWPKIRGTTRIGYSGGRFDRQGAHIQGTWRERLGRLVCGHGEVMASAMRYLIATTKIRRRIQVEAKRK